MQGLPLLARAWHANRFPQGLVYLACQYQPLLSGTAGMAIAIQAVDIAGNSLAIRPADPDRPVQIRKHSHVKHLHHQ